MAYPKLTDEPTATELAAQIRNGSLTPLEATDAAIARIEQMDGAINAVVVRDFDRARDAAKALGDQEPREDQPLFGVPMTIKESFDIAGLQSCWGEERDPHKIAASDARVVTQLKNAGAVMLGKTNIPPLLADWQSDNPVYGRTNNPHDHTRSPGGSSGGAAAAVASGMVPVEYGTDIGGSVRVPAHFCGIWGHKTTWGLVSKQGHDHPLMPHAGHDGVLSIAGPLARDADDLEVLLRLTALVPVRASGKRLKDCRVLAVTDQTVSPVDSSVSEPVDAALSAIEAAGVTIDRTSDLLPDLAAQHGEYMRMLGIAMARGAPGPDGKRATATDWFNLLDKQAHSELAWEKLFERYDFVIAPPAPILAFEHDNTPIRERSVTINGEQRPFAEVFAWAGISTLPNLPSTVLPIGETGGLPCGIQIIGPRWSDFDCIAAARQIGAILS